MCIRDSVYQVAVVIRFGSGVDLNARVPTVGYYPETGFLIAQTGYFPASPLKFYPESQIEPEVRQWHNTWEAFKVNTDK